MVLDLSPQGLGLVAQQVGLVLSDVARRLHGRRRPPLNNRLCPLGQSCVVKVGRVRCGNSLTLERDFLSHDVVRQLDDVLPGVSNRQQDLHPFLAAERLEAVRTVEPLHGLISLRGGVVSPLDLGRLRYLRTRPTISRLALRHRHTNIPEHITSGVAAQAHCNLEGKQSKTQSARI